MAAPQLDSTGVVARDSDETLVLLPSFLEEERVRARLLLIPLNGSASSETWCDVSVGGVVRNTSVPGVMDAALELWKAWDYPKLELNAGRHGERAEALYWHLSGSHMQGFSVEQPILPFSRKAKMIAVEVDFAVRLLASGEFTRMSGAYMRIMPLVKLPSCGLGAYAASLRTLELGDVNYALNNGHELEKTLDSLTSLVSLILGYVEDAGVIFKHAKCLEIFRAKSGNSECSGVNVGFHCYRNVDFTVIGMSDDPPAVSCISDISETLYSYTLTGDHLAAARRSKKVDRRLADFPNLQFVEFNPSGRLHGLAMDARACAALLRKGNLKRLW